MRQEVLAQCQGRSEPYFGRNALHRQIGRFQKLLRTRKPFRRQPLYDRHAGRLAEPAGESAPTHVGSVRQHIQRNDFCEMRARPFEYARQSALARQLRDGLFDELGLPALTMGRGD